MVGQELEVQQKKELTSQQEKTIPARFYVPPKFLNFVPIA